MYLSRCPITLATRVGTTWPNSSNGMHSSPWSTWAVQVEACEPSNFIKMAVWMDLIYGYGGQMVSLPFGLQNIKKMWTWGCQKPSFLSQGKNLTEPRERHRQHPGDILCIHGTDCIHASLCIHGSHSASCISLCIHASHTSSCISFALHPASYTASWISLCIIHAFHPASFMHLTLLKACLTSLDIPVKCDNTFQFLESQFYWNFKKLQPKGLPLI